MKKLIALILILGLATAYADERKKSEKKSAKPAKSAKAASKSGNNGAQKTESAVGSWAHKNKIWMHSSSKK